MKKVLYLIFASLLVLGACGQEGDKSNKDDNKKSEIKSDKKSNDSNKDKSKDNDKKKSENKSKKENKNTHKDNEKESSQDKSSSNKQQTNEQPTQQTQTTQKPQSQQTKQANNQKQDTQQQATSNQQNAIQQNDGMTQAEIDEWNRTKPTTHNESQMGYGRAEYEEARKASEQVWDNPNAHIGGPSWVGKNEGYDSWAKRQQEVQENSEVLQQ